MKLDADHFGVYFINIQTLINDSTQEAKLAI